MRNFKELIIWQKAFLLSKKIYQITEKFPSKESYSLTDQIRRASVSVVSNIAEEHQRQSTKDFYRFLCIAYGSCAEVETQILLAREFGYIDPKNLAEILSILDEVQKLLTVFMKKVQQQ